MLWDKIQKILSEKKMSINQLSLKMGLSKNNRTMYQLRNGKIKKPSFELMCKIADALDVSLDIFKEQEDVHVTITKTPKVTGKGQVYFVNKFVGEE